MNGITSEYAERTYPDLSANDGAPWKWSRFDWEKDFPGSVWAAGRRNLIPHSPSRLAPEQFPVSQEARDYVAQLRARHAESLKQRGATEAWEQREIYDRVAAFYELEDVLRDHHGSRHNRIDNAEALKRIEIAYLLASGWRPV